MMTTYQTIRVLVRCSLLAGALLGGARAGAQGVATNVPDEKAAALKRILESVQRDPGGGDDRGHDPTADAQS